MTWQVLIQPKAARRLEKLPHKDQVRLLRYLRDRVATADDPRLIAAILKGSEGLWRFRVGDYRIIAHIDDHTITVLVLDLGHRREIYR